MAPRTTKSAPAPAPADEAPAAPAADDVTKTYLRDLDTLITVTSPKTRADYEVKEGIRRALAARHQAIDEAIDRLLETYDLDDIVSFSAVQIPLLPTVVERDGKVKVEWPFKIIGPDD